MIRILLLLACMGTLFSACRKQGIITDCDALKSALSSQDAAAVSQQVEHLLVKHSKGNVERFSEALSEQCDITIKSVCFNCIKTMPEQTLIILEFTLSGVTIQRELDLSYRNDNNRMIVSSVHE